MRSSATQLWDDDLDTADLQASVVNLQGLELDLDDLFCHTPSPLQDPLPTAAMPHDCSQATRMEPATAEHLELTLSQLSCDLEDLRMDGPLLTGEEGALTSRECAAAFSQELHMGMFEDEEEVFQYLTAV